MSQARLKLDARLSRGYLTMLGTRNVDKATLLVLKLGLHGRIGAASVELCVYM